MPAITLEVKGSAELQQRFLQSPQAVAAEVHNGLQEALLLIESDARRRVPADTRQLMGSITSRVSGTGISLIGEVGPSKAYGLFVEKGTKPHWPPLKALEGWARRHGTSPYLVALGISRHGTRAQPFMQPALEKNLGRIEAIFSRLGASIVSRLSR